MNFGKKRALGNWKAECRVAKIMDNNYDYGVYERNLPEKERFAFCFF